MTDIDRCDMVYAGAATAWKRSLLFLGTCLAGHVIGLVAANTVVGPPLRVEVDLDAFVALPFGYLLQFLAHAAYLPLSIVYFTLLAAFFWIILFTETSPGLSVPPLLVLQIWDTFFIQRKLELINLASRDEPLLFSNWGPVIAGVGTIAALFIFIVVLKQQRFQPD